MKFSFQGPRAVKRRASVQGLWRVQLWHSSLAARLQKRSLSWSASTGRSSQDISISRPLQRSSSWSHSRWWCSKWSQWWQGPNLHQYLQLLWVCRLSLLSIPSAGLPGRRRGELDFFYYQGYLFYSWRCYSIFQTPCCRPSMDSIAKNVKSIGCYTPTIHLRSVRWVLYLQGHISVNQ